MPTRPDWRGEEWDKWGKTNPYFGVSSRPENLSDRIDEAARARFFESGAAEIAETMDEMRRVAGAGFSPGRVLDFGCGVGRLTIPLARVARHVVGVDVSPAMIEEARANCRRAGITNVEFKASAGSLEGIDGPFDFVHSFIVFQHIPPEIGYGLFEAILDRLAPDGCGMLHFTHARRGSRLRLFGHRARRSSRVVHRLLNLAQGRPADAPLMAMFEYDLDRLLEMLRTRGLERVGGRLTDHDGLAGIMLGFARPVDEARIRSHPV
jgi:2-polyprenyl-3-methyl-5-hydroxy-6-metoxy-1,4-benzoquinol methylase